MYPILCPKKINVTILSLSILITFDTNLTEKVGNQTVLYFPTSPN